MWTYIGLHYDLQVHRYGEVNSYIYAIFVSKYQKHEQRRILYPLYSHLILGLIIIWKYKIWTLDLWGASEHSFFSTLMTVIGL